MIDTVNPNDTFGGLSDGYRRKQLGVPTATVGRPPSFKGVNADPGSQIKAPKILASAARQNAGTNVAIPYARVVPYNSLSDKGRLEPGDVAFLHRNRYSSFIQHGQELKHNAAAKNAWQQQRVSVSCQTPHAQVHHLAGLDWVNRQLAVYSGGRTVLVNSNNPSDHWRSLSFLAEWIVDGIVLSNDSPGFTMTSSECAWRTQCARFTTF